MYLLTGTALVTSASDLTLASDCEFALLRVLDVRLGWASKDDIPPDDAMLERAAVLGGVHEHRLLDRYRVEHGAALVELPEDRPRDVDGLRARAAQTRDALLAGAPVVYQGVLFDEADPELPFVGYADFLVRRPDGRYRVVDTKLARHVKVTAMLQLAAYHEQLERLGIPVDDTVELILGDDRAETAHIDDIRPVFRRRRARMHQIIAEHRAEREPVRWGDDRYAIDGRCKYCEGPAADADDLITVAGMRLAQRAQLRAAGITTLTELATLTEHPAGCDIPLATYAKLQQQAALQAQAALGDPHVPPPFEVIDARPIAGLPAPSPGDLFFDFEGDPMYSELQPDGAPRWGLDYLFGWVDVAGEFRALWAHDQASEATALIEFLDHVAARLAEHPDLHIYHYAAYEKTHLLSIAARHGVGEAVVDDLLRRGVLVDLYPVVMASLRVGAPSYSIKKLEPLYMGEDEREGVANAADSVVQYAAYRAARDDGRQAEADDILADIAQYNAYDCRSTLRLRDWLRARPEAQGIAVDDTSAERDVAAFEVSVLDRRLQAHGEAAAQAGRQEDAAAYRLAAAAIDFHRREAKSFWWEHFDRLEQPAEHWQDTRGVFTVDRGTSEAGWSGVGPRGGAPKRVLRLSGVWAPGSSQIRDGLDAFLVYGEPVPFAALGHRVGQRIATYAKFVGETATGDVLVTEILPAGAAPWDAMPTHLAPGPPPRADSLQVAIEQWGAMVADAADSAAGWPPDAMSRVLRRSAPSAAGALEPMRDADDAVRAVIASLRAMDRGYLAVQGPPGTGKTYLAAHVIKALVERHHWAIGVTAQSHKVIENLLDAIHGAGVPRPLIGKKPGKGDSGGTGEAAPKYTVLTDDNFPGFARDNQPTGYVIGGTAWDMTNRRRVLPDQLDLLVIDEAGQFSLANTIATALSAKRVLLLGDPQQLPQVSQGIHPAPVDGSALGHIIGGHAVLPDEYGYFLAESRRMDEAVTEPVSRLAYDGQLRSHASTHGRRLDGVAPGLHAVPVVHVGNATSSPEEAEAVVDLVAQHLGRAWAPGAGETARPMTHADLIVVTPYNAQVELLRQSLDAAGYGQVPVGTVDKFQGREAVIAIVSLAASEAAEVPRGMDFLLGRNRLNVSISRAKWAAYLVHSPALADHLPHTPEGLATLSRFITLVSADAPSIPWGSGAT